MSLHVNIITRLCAYHGSNRAIRTSAVPPKEVPRDPVGHSFSDRMGLYIHIVEYILNTFGPRQNLRSAAFVPFSVNMSFSAVFILAPDEVMHNIFARVYTNLCTSHPQGSTWTLPTRTSFLHMDSNDFYGKACDMGSRRRLCPLVDKGNREVRSAARSSEDVVRGLYAMRKVD